MKMIALIPLVALLLFGCAKPPGDLRGTDPEVAIAEAKALQACREYQQMQAVADEAAYESMPASHKAFVQINRDTMRTVRLLAGVNTDLCAPGTNIYDATVAYYKYHAQEAASWAGVVKTGVITGGTVWAFNGLWDALNRSNIDVSAGGDVKMSDTGNTLSAGKDAVMFSGDESVINKSDTDVVQTQTAAETTGDNNYEPTEPVAEGAEVEEPESFVEIQELETVE